MYHSRVSSTSWPLANSGSTRASATQWNARSQAAYQGYSHLSGIETMSALSRCRQWALRPWRWPSGGGGLGRVAVEPGRDVVVEELLAPDHPGEGLPLHGAGVRVGDLGLERRVELVGFGPAQAHD